MMGIQAITSVTKVKVKILMSDRMQPSSKSKQVYNHGMQHFNSAQCSFFFCGYICSRYSKTLQRWCALGVTFCQSFCQQLSENLFSYKMHSFVQKSKVDRLKNWNNWNIQVSHRHEDVIHNILIKSKNRLKQNNDVHQPCHYISLYCISDILG